MCDVNTEYETKYATSENSKKYWSCTWTISQSIRFKRVKGGAKEASVAAVSLGQPVGAFCFFVVFAGFAGFAGVFRYALSTRVVIFVLFLWFCLLMVLSLGFG